MTRGLSFALILMASLAISRAAVARERLAVAVLVQGNSNLSDSLTEVAVAELSVSNGEELVGLLEMRARHEEITSTTLPRSEQSTESCLLEPICARRLTGLLGASRFLLGLVTPTSDSYGVVWSLLDVASEQQRLVSRTRILRDEDRLIMEVRRDVVNVRTARDGDATLANRTFVAKSLTDVPTFTPGLPTADPLGSGIRLAPSAPFVVDDSLTTRAITVYVGAALTTAVLSAAVVTGFVAAGSPKGNTRRDAQEDYEHRQRYASATHGLVLVGGILGTATAVSWVWHWR